MTPARCGICLMFLSLLCLATAAMAACLTVSAGDEGDPLVSFSIEDGYIVHLDFINSIYLAPVRETFLYETGKGFSIIRVESPSAGVFEYYRLETDGPSAELYRHVGIIRLRSHDYENHVLTVGGKPLHLKGLAEGGDPLTISVHDGACGSGEGR